MGVGRIGERRMGGEWGRERKDYQLLHLISLRSPSYCVHAMHTVHVHVHEDYFTQVCIHVHVHVGHTHIKKYMLHACVQYLST